MYTLIYKHIHSHGFVDATVQSTINTKEHSAAKKLPRIILSPCTIIFYTGAAVAVTARALWVWSTL